MSLQETYDNRYKITTTSKLSLCYYSKKWIINKRDAQNLEAAHMTFLRPLLGLAILDHQRNPCNCNRLKVDKLVEDIKLNQKI
jgi:hypothetical protein